MPPKTLGELCGSQVLRPHAEPGPGAARERDAPERDRRGPRIPPERIPTSRGMPHSARLLCTPYGPGPLGGGLCRERAGWAGFRAQGPGSKIVVSRLRGFISFGGLEDLWKIFGRSLDAEIWKIFALDPNESSLLLIAVHIDPMNKTTYLRMLM